MEYGNIIVFNISGKGVNEINCGHNQSQWDCMRVSNGGYGYMGIIWDI
jgi:hypothetical protein